MKHWPFSICAGVVLASAGCDPKPAAAPAPKHPTTNGMPVKYHLDQAQPKLQTMKLWVGSKELDAEIAASITEIATGMMFRTNMLDSEAMLFVFATPDRREFYMKNCVVALSAGYIDANGILDEIVELQPGELKPVPSRSDKIKYVLEVPQGWFKRHNIAVGATIMTDKGPLKQFSGLLQ